MEENRSTVGRSPAPAFQNAADAAQDQSVWSLGGREVDVEKVIKKYRTVNYIGQESGVFTSLGSLTLTTERLIFNGYIKNLTMAIPLLHVAEVELISGSGASNKIFAVRYRDRVARNVAVHAPSADGCGFELGSWTAKFMPAFLDARISAHERALVGATREDHRATLLGNLGLLFAEAGRMQDAMTCVQEVLDLEPDDAAAYATLGIIQNEIGRADSAIESWAIAAELSDDVDFINAMSELIDSSR